MSRYCVESWTLALLIMGCSSSSATQTATVPTRIVVDPARFLGNVPCLDTPGGLRQYVATLQDVTPGLYGTAGGIIDGGYGGASGFFPLPSSGPVSCGEPVAFGLVTDGHYYLADIQGFDRADLIAAAAGSPVMLDPTGQYVPPRWTTSCGHTNPARCTNNWMVPVIDCAPLADTATFGDTAIVVQFGSALGTLVCGDDKGQVSRFSVRRAGQSGLGQAGSSCDAEAIFSGLVPGQGYTFLVEGFEADATMPRWGGTCDAIASGGVTQPAACDPLTERGALMLDLASWLAAGGLACGPDGITLATVSISTPEGVRTESRQGPNCGNPVYFNALPPGVYQLVIGAQSSSGEVTGRCEGSVMPGRSTIVACDPLGA